MSRGRFLFLDHLQTSLDSAAASGFRPREPGSGSRLLRSVEPDSYVIEASEFSDSDSVALTIDIVMRRSLLVAIARNAQLMGSRPRVRSDCTRQW